MCVRAMDSSNGFLGVIPPRRFSVWVVILAVPLHRLLTLRRIWVRDYVILPNRAVSVTPSSVLVVVLLMQHGVIC
jgi:hypothetical protein